MRKTWCAALAMIVAALCVAVIPCRAAEADITTARIVGSWKDTGAENDVSGERITTFNADGTYAETVTLRFQGKIRKERLTGKWKLVGSTLETINSTTTNPGIEKPGELTRLKVAAVTEDRLELRYENGETETLKRVAKPD